MSSEIPLSQRIEARIQRHKDASASLDATAMSTSALTSTTLPPYTTRPAASAIDPALPILASLQSNLDVASTESIQRAKELSTARAKVLALERENQRQSSEVKAKETALRRTLSEATGERQALIEALADARAQVDTLREDSRRREDIVARLETRLTKASEDLTQLSAKLVQTERALSDESVRAREAAQALSVVQARAEAAEYEAGTLKAEQVHLKQDNEALRVAASKAALLEVDLASLRAKFAEEEAAWRKGSAELQQCRNETSTLDARVRSLQNDARAAAASLEGHQALEEEVARLRKRHRALADEHEQLATAKEFFETSVAQERGAAIELCNYLRVLVSSDVDVTRARTDAVPAGSSERDLTRSGYRAADARQYTELAGLSDKLTQYKDTAVYTTFSTLLGKVRAEVSRKFQLLQDNEGYEQELGALRRDLAALQEAKEALAGENARLEAGAGRLTESYDLLKRDCDELTAARARLQAENERYRLEGLSAQQILGSVVQSARRLSLQLPRDAPAGAPGAPGAALGTEGVPNRMSASLGASLGAPLTTPLGAPLGASTRLADAGPPVSDVASQLAGYVARLQAEVQALTRETDELSYKLRQLEAANTDLSSAHTDATIDRELGKKRLVELTAGVAALEGDNRRLQTTLIQSAQINVLMVRDAADRADALARMALSRAIAGRVLASALAEIRTTRDLLARYAPDPAPPRRSRAARKLRTIVYGAVFAAKLRRYAQEVRGGRQRQEARIAELLPAAAAATATGATAAGAGAAPNPILELAGKLCAAVAAQARMLGDYRFAGVAVMGVADRAVAVARVLAVVDLPSALPGYERGPFFTAAALHDLYAGIDAVVRQAAGHKTSLDYQLLTLPNAAAGVCNYIVRRADAVASQLADARGSLALLDTEYAGAKAKNADLAARVQALTARAEALAAEIRTDYVAVAEYEGMLKERDALRFKLNNVTYTHEEQTKDAEALRADALMSKREIDRLSAQLRAAEADARDAAARAADAGAGLAQYKTIAAGHEARLRAADAEREEARRLGSLQQEELAGLRARVAELDGALASKNRELLDKDSMTHSLRMRLGDEADLRRHAEERLSQEEAGRAARIEARVNLGALRTTTEEQVTRDIAGLSMSGSGRVPRADAARSVQFGSVTELSMPAPAGAPAGASAGASVGAGAPSVPPSYGAGAGAGAGYLRSTLNTSALNTYSSTGAAPKGHTMAKEEIKNLIAELDRSLGL